jgi:oxygen-independent coproporphyrinogen-3 oxidase
MIYLHVPFCRSFCTYCDFYSEIACKGKDEAAIARWADDVCKEIEARRQEIEATLDLNTLYIGGGTPSVLPLSVLQQILSKLAEVPFAEFTIEVNPEDIVERGEEYVRGLLDLGVNRISMGVQSLDDGILRWMNRRHSADGARTAFSIISGQGSPQQTHATLGTVRGGTMSKANGGVETAEQSRQFAWAAPDRKRAIDISVDLITGVPGMTMEILERTVEEVIGWRPEHISAYQLSIEEGSALARMIERGEVEELDEEACRAQYDYLCRRLAEAGYHHYEISNWALPGHEAVHNSAYWTRHPYVGLGPGAHSLAIGRAMPVQSAPCGSLTGPLPVAEGKQRRSWNSQELCGWTSQGEDLTPEQIHEEEVMLLARTDKGPIPERDWFIADEIILQQLSS